MNVPHARSLLPQTGKVPLDQHCAGLCSLGRDNHVGPLHVADLAGPPDLDHRPRVLHFGEERPTGHDDWVAFANHFRTPGHMERFGDSVCTGVDKQDLSAQRGCVDGLL